jgi:hypothetical protein
MALSRQILRQQTTEDKKSITRMQKLALRAIKRFPDPDTEGMTPEEATEAWAKSRSQRRVWIGKQAAPVPTYRPVYTLGKTYPAHPPVAVETSAEDLEKAFVDAMDHVQAN